MKKSIINIFLLLIFMIFMEQAWADDIFQVRTPNVMIIFDTSLSMEMSVSLNTKGESIWHPQALNYEKTSPHGGNHPDSRLYHAKSALKDVLEQVVKDKVNLGFSTYAQIKIDKWRGKYKVYKKTQNATPAKYYRYKRYYRWRTANVSSPSRSVFSPYEYSFTDHNNKSWGSIINPVTVGFEFSEMITIHDKSGPLHPKYISENNFQKTATYQVKWKVVKIDPPLENGLYKFTYQVISPEYDLYEEKTFSQEESGPGSCGEDKKDNPWANQQPGTPTGTPKWETYFSDKVGPNNEYNTGGNNRPANHWKCWTKEVPPVEEKWEWKEAWYDTSGSTCSPTKTKPDDYGTWTWDLIPGTCFDVSDYRYPGNPNDTTKNPHTWSYYHIDNKGWWSYDDQKTPFYPAPAGDPGQNDNHYFFINFPDDKDPSFKASDRTTILNKILSLLDLTPVKHPETGNYWTKLPIHAIEGRSGITSATTAVDIDRQTPLADSLKWAYKYFYDYIYEYQCPGCPVKGDPSSQQKFGETLCRGNYIILITDGLESCRFDGAKPNYQAAIAEAADLYAINVQTFVIGFGEDVLKSKEGFDAINGIAFAGSGGKYTAFFTTDKDSLFTALQTIFQTITGQYYGRSNPVITKARDRLYRGNFEIIEGDWLGHLMAWDADKKTGVLAPDFAWDAGEVMKTYGRGKVYTWTDSGLNPTLKEFKASESSLYTPINYVNPNNADIDGNGITEDFVDEKTIINFTLDPNYNDGINGPGYYKGKRAINWKLGDIYHSTPVVIGEPSFFFTENDYASFYSANKNREVMIYVGTNDGMLHAFNNTDGSEKFAIIPKNLLGKLKNLGSVHDFYVDSSPKAYDVYFKGEGKWKTVLITGERAGGDYYFALDVTDPNNPKVLWEWTHTTLGQTWAKPDIGRINVGGQTKFVAFITGGYSNDTNDNKGNSFHVVDIEDLTVYRSFTVRAGGESDDKRKVPSGPIAFDANNDGFIDYVYFGDIMGGLWKVNVSSANPMDWGLYQLYQVPINGLLDNGIPKPIYHTPAVTKNDEGKILVFFGTGDEKNLLTETYNYFYEIEDQGTTGNKNWRVDLEKGEKVLASPAVANAVVYFTTWVYKGSGQFCGAGEGRLYGRTVTKMGAPGGAFGLVTLDPKTGKWTSPQSYMSLGAGIPSAPVVTNGMVYVSSSLNANKVIQIPIPPWAIARLKSWREVF